MDKRITGNIAMAVSKFFSGFNQNALKYLVPKWMSPISGVAFRLCFGSVAFWIMGAFKKAATPATTKQKLGMLALGLTFMFGYMYFLLAGLKYTTPVTSSIFISLEPAVVFIICAIFQGEKVTPAKIAGIVLGIGGALVIILTTHTQATATRPLLGCLLCALSTITFSTYLVINGRYVSKLDSVTVSKWTFSGGAISAIAAVLIVGWDAPVTHHLWSWAGFALAYVLLFPTVISYLLQEIGLRDLPDTVVALYGNVILIVSTIASYVLKQDHFSWWQMLAIALMIGSVYLVEVAERRTTSTRLKGANPQSTDTPVQGAAQGAGPNLKKS